MKKQFLNIKNFVQDGLTVVRGDKSDVMTVDLVNAEKKVDLMKVSCQSTEKKIAGCLRGYGSGTEIEKRSKKIPELHLSQCLLEHGEQLGADSLLGQTLIDCGELQKSIGRELINYEMEVEKNCLTALNYFIDNDIPNVVKSRKQLNKATSDMDTCRQKYQQAMKQSHQSTGSSATVAAANKLETIKQELEESTTKVEQAKDAFAIEVFNFLSREPDVVQVYLEFVKFQAAFHRRSAAILEEAIPKLEQRMANNSQRPIFGTSLEEHLRITNREIALVIEACIGWLLMNIKEEGIFRVPGSVTKVKKLKSSLNAGVIDFDEYMRDPHTVAGCLKSYLRELPDPLLTHQHYQAWINAAKIIDSNSRLQAFWQICNSLPKSHHNNLRYLIKFLAKLSSHSETNKMTPSNISIALAPSLIWSPPAEVDDAFGANMAAANLHSLIVEALVSYADWFFPEEIEFTSPQISYLPEEKPLNGEISQERHPTPVPRASAPRSNKKPAPPAPSNPPTTSSSSCAPSSSDKNQQQQLNQQNERTTSLSNSHSPANFMKSQGYSPTTTVKPVAHKLENFSSESPPLSSSSSFSSDVLADQLSHVNTPQAHSNSLINSERLTSFLTGSLDRKQLRSSLDRKSERKAKATSFIGNPRTPRFNVIEKPAIPPPVVPSAQSKQSTHSIERPNFPPPERPSRDPINQSLKQSLENIFDLEEALESSTEETSIKLYPDLSQLASDDDLTTARSSSSDVNEGQSKNNITTKNNNNNNENFASTNPDKEMISFADDSEEEFLSKLGNRDSSSSEDYNQKRLDMPPDKPKRASPHNYILNNVNNHPEWDNGDSRCNSGESQASVTRRPPRPLPPAPAIAVKPKITTASTSTSENTYL